MELETDQPYLSTGQAARALGVSRFTVLRAVRRGEIAPAHRTPGGYLRFDPVSVAAYAQRLSTHDHPPVAGCAVVGRAVASAARVRRRDISERKRGEEALRHQALHDALTGLPNRTLLLDRLEQALTAARRVRLPCALLLLDLDHFKEVNDTLGHQVGDALLQEVSARLRAALRAVDTVARLGGDEFAVLLPDADEAGAIGVARVLRGVLERPILVEGQPLAVEGSVGIALAAPTADASALLRQADVAMYMAKRAHSGHALYDPASDAHDPERLALLGALRQALEEDALELHYQPQVVLTSGLTCGVEALLRWPHPTRGFIAPDKFIPLAEQTGLIGPLTRWVLETALRQVQAWQEEGLSVGLSVNLSARTLHDPDLPVLVASLLEGHTVAPDLLTLEITESALMIDPARARDTLVRLTALGVRIAIDDFGTGYSSLGYLKQLPVAEVKIDQSFVRGLGDATDVKDAAIVCAVIALAQALGLNIVAEGVETGAAWNRLRALGCALAQGYYLSRPLPACEMTRWLRAAPSPPALAAEAGRPLDAHEPESATAVGGPDAIALRAAYATMPYGVVVRDAAGIVVEANAAAEQILGHALTRMRGRPLAAALGATTRADGSPLPAEERPVAIAFRTGQPQRDCLIGITRPDGARRWVSMDVMPLRDGDETLQHVVVRFLDITARIHAEEAARAAETRFRALTELIPEALVCVDARGTVISWNMGAVRLFGYAVGEAVGQPITTLLGERVRTALQHGVDRIAATGVSGRAGQTLWALSVVVRRKDGQDCPLDLSLTTWTDQGGRLAGRLIRATVTNPSHARDTRSLAVRSA